MLDLDEIFRILYTALNATTLTVDQRARIEQLFAEEVELSVARVLDRLEQYKHGELSGLNIRKLKSKAKAAEIPKYGTMNKMELVEAIAKATTPSSP